MFRAMAMKELREVGGIGLAALAAQIYLAIAAVHPDIFPFIRRFGPGSPFINDSFVGLYGFICVITAIALGTRQTLGESTSGTYPFLFHRPAGRRWLIGMKLLVGMTVYLVCGAVSIVAYGAWAATPGTHPSPFEWSMALIAWASWLGMSILYLGAFLSGIRPGRWLGTRLWPLGAACIAIFFTIRIVYVYQQISLMGLMLLIDAWLMGVIFHVARSRDYS